MAVHTGKLILVADDEPAVRELICEWLAMDGHDTITAGTGQEALDILLSQRVDLALLDVMMPEGSGFAVCCEIKSRAETRLTPVVLVTGLESRQDRIRGIECGADDFVSKPAHREELLARVRSLLRLKQFTDELESAEKVIFALALSIEAKDPYTEGHCERLSIISVALAERLGLPEEQRQALRRAGIAHDIGKVAVPDHILLKPGCLTPEEQRIMRVHPITGERICSPLRSFRLVLPIIRHHHEKMDGSGYPDGLKGEQIPLTARVLETADIYDALTTDRSYHKALSPYRAITQMREEAARGWWDTRLIDELDKLLQVSSAPGSCEFAQSGLIGAPDVPWPMESEPRRPLRDSKHPVASARGLLKRHKPPEPRGDINVVNCIYGRPWRPVSTGVPYLHPLITPDVAKDGTHRTCMSLRHFLADSQY